MASRKASRARSFQNGTADPSAFGPRDDSKCKKTKGKESGSHAKGAQYESYCEELVVSLEFRFSVGRSGFDVSLSAASELAVPSEFRFSTGRSGSDVSLTGTSEPVAS